MIDGIPLWNKKGDLNSTGQYQQYCKDSMVRMENDGMKIYVAKWCTERKPGTAWSGWSEMTHSEAMEMMKNK